MNIAFITPEYVTESNFDGGLANYLGRTCPALVAMGHEVTVIVATDTTGMSVHDGVEVHRVQVRTNVLRWLNRLTLWRLSVVNQWFLQSWLLNRLCKKLHRKRPFDIIQYASYSATALFRAPGIPAVVRLSSFNSLWRKHYDRPMNLSGRLEDWLEIKSISKANDVFGPSRIIADHVGHVLNKNIQVIESPFSQTTTSGADNVFSALLQGKKYILFFGSLGVLKGVDTIAAVLDSLLANNPDLCVVFAGKDLGYKGRPMMDHVWYCAGVHRGRVHYLGKMPRAFLDPLISYANLVVLPSKIDNFPNTCLEAMSYHRIVVGTRGASFEQIIEDGVSGFLCEIDSPGNLQEVIQKAIDLPPESRKQMGEQAAIRIETLRPEIVVHELVEFYQAVIDR